MSVRLFSQSAKRLYVLEIPDDYQFMDPELVELLMERVEPYLQQVLNDLE